MAARFALQLLGPPLLTCRGRPVQLSRRKAAALLAYLAMEARPQSREAMAALFWPDCREARARANLRRCLFELGSLVAEGALAAEREMLAVPDGGVATDVEEFRRLARGCGRHEAQELCDDCMRLLQEAADLYHGDFLSGFTLADCIEFDRWQTWRGLQLRAEVTSVLRRVIRGQRRRGRLAQAIGGAQRLLSLDPLEESAHRELMRLYADTGEWAMAVRQYEECRRALRHELGTEPDETTRHVYVAAREHRLVAEPDGAGRVLVEPTAPTASVASVAAEQRRLRLPAPPTPLIGREREIARARAVVESKEAALLTVTGPGGCGKTRLALGIAAAQGARFEDGVFFVDLAPLGARAQIVPAIARAIGLRQQNRRPLIETVKDYLAPRRTLLLLDNFEHLADGAPLVAELLSACPRLAVLVTSRQSLHIRGETELPVPPLDLPDRGAGEDLEILGRASAVRLFVERASEARPDFELTAGNARLVAEACRRLDGLPLAIELAAPHLKALSLHDLVQRLASPLEFLKDGALDLPPRQQALRSTLDWSYGLLGPGERHLLAAVSVFRGGFGLEAAEQVCGGTGRLRPARAGTLLGDLESLTDKSLLRRARDGGGTRFQLLETIREFAAGQLTASGGTEAVRERHAEFYLDLAEAAARKVHGPDQMAWLQRIERDHDNLLAAHRWLVDSAHGSEALRLACALEWFWFTRGYAAQGQRCVEQALAAAGEGADPGLKGMGLYALARMVFLRGEWIEARMLCAEGVGLLRRAGDDPGVALALSFQGVAERFQGDDRRGALDCDEAIEIARKAGDPWLVAFMFIRAYATVGGKVAGDTPRERLEQAVELTRRWGDLWSLAHSLNGLGDLLRERGQYEEARERYGEALKGFTALDDDRMNAWTLEGLGRTWSLEGDHGRAEEHLSAAIRIFHRLGDRGDTVFILQRLGADARAAGDHARGAALLGAWCGLRGLSWRPGAALRGVPRDLAAAVRQYADRHPREWARGQAMDLDEAVDFALRRR